VGIEPRPVCRTKSRKCRNGFSHLDYSKVDQLNGTEVPPRNVRLVFEDGVWGVFSVWPSRVAQQGCVFTRGSCRSPLEYVKSMQPESKSGDMSHDSCDPRDVEEVRRLSGADRGPPSPLLILRNTAILSGMAAVPFQIPVSHPPSLYIQKIAQPNASSFFSTL